MSFCKFSPKVGEMDCAHYHVNGGHYVLCYYPHFKKPDKRAFSILVDERCPIYCKGGGVVEKKLSQNIQHSSGKNVGALVKVGRCPDCGALMRRKTAARCKVCSKRHYSREYKRRKTLERRLMLNEQF